MTTYLFSLLTAGGDKMAATDPHGWTLSLISVSVVFCALVILYFLYTFIGNLNTGKYKISKKPKSSKTSDNEIAAAIALALKDHMGNEDEVAVALALHLYLSDCIHDAEPGFITIKRKESGWDNKALTFRRKP